MDEFDYSQLLDDDDDFFGVEEQDFPTFEVNFEESIGSFSTNNETAVPDALESSEATCTNSRVQTSNHAKNPNADVSRFPLVTSDAIEELKSVTLNKNTSRSTKQWMNVFKSWCMSRHFENVNIETVAPVDLDKLLTQFYAEVKRKDGEDYEPESLRIMQSSIERYLKEKNYPVSIVTGREFHKSQEILNAKAITLRQQGKGKRPNKAQPLAVDEETALWENGQLGDFNGRVLTNVNFKNLTEQLGLRGRQEHYESYVEDLVVREHEDGSETVVFNEGPTKTRSGGLRIRRRTTPQMMYSTDGGERDPVRLFKLWLSKRPVGMKDNGPLYLSIVNRPKSNDVWYCKTRMGQNTIGTIMKSMASTLTTTKKLTNHSMRKTLVQKLKKSGQPRHVICEITGHARESSLDDYDEIDENQRKELSHIISGYNPSHQTQNQSQALQASSPAIVQRAALPLSDMAPRLNIQNSSVSNATVPQLTQLQQGHMYQAMGFNTGFLPAGFQEGFQVNPADFGGMARMAAYSSTASSTQSPSQNYSGCTFNFYSSDPKMSQQPQKKRRAYIIESDEED